MNGNNSVELDEIDLIWLEIEEKKALIRILDEKCKEHEKEMGWEVPKYIPSVEVEMKYALQYQICELLLEGLKETYRFIEKLLLTNQKYRKAT